jgi:osmotically-inducible protein OsmY
MRAIGRTGALFLTLAAMALAAACAHTPATSPAPAVERMPAPANASSAAGGDEVAAARLTVALNDDPVYFFRHVYVHVDDGVADLSGYVWSSDAIYRARRIALEVPGVRQVVTSHLELERNGFSYGPAR